MANTNIYENQLTIVANTDLTSTGYVRVVDASGNSRRVTIANLATYLAENGAIATLVGDLDNLSTSVKTSIVNAINAVNTQVATNTANITTNTNDITDLKNDLGELSNLDTTNKSSIVNAINEVAGGSGSGLTADIKTALLQIAQKVAYIDDDGQTYYDALEDALYPPANLVSISAVYTQSGTVYDTDSLNELKSDLVVTAHYDDSSTSTVTTYTLSGTLTAGTSTVTVAYGGKTTTFSVTVTASPLVPTGYTQVDYLLSTQSTSSSGGYINTGVSFSSAITTGVFEVDVLPVTDSLTTSEYIMGTRQTETGSTNNVGLGLAVTPTKDGFSLFSGSPGAILSVADIYQRRTITGTWTDGELTLTDGTNTETNTQETRGCVGYPICLFGLKKAANSQYTNLGNMRIYRAKAYENGTLILDMIPCTRDSDDAVGMYDRVNETFVTPSGTASCITAGSDE